MSLNIGIGPAITRETTLGAGGGGGFSPDDIDGLNLWLDADAEYLLTEPSARDFESTNTEYFSVAAPATDYDLGTADFGIALNVKRETAGTQQVICGKYLDSSNYWMFYINASNLLRFYCLVGGLEVADITGTTALSSTSVYYHLAVVLDRDSAANTKLYVDGADDTSGTPTISATDCTLNTAFEVGRTSTAFVPIGNLSFSVQTVGASDTFDMIHPITNATVHSFTIDWGDGSSDTVTSKTDPNLTHTYAVEDEYTINLSGSLDDFAFNNGGDKTMVTAVNNVAGDTLGLADAYRMFYGCTNLTTIVSGCFDDCAGFATIGFADTFRNCTSLTSIPTDLFRYSTAVSASGFQNTFNGCSGLTSIPTDLFRYNTSVSTNGFTDTFRDCSSLTSIPTDLFSYNTAVSSSGFQNTFYGCSSLTSIPTDLFRYNTSVSTNGFVSTFRNCSSLTSIPTDLFRYNTAVSSAGFQNTFNNCSGLTSIPTDLFRYNTSVSTNGFFRTFLGCTSLTSIPTDLFSYNTAVSSSGFQNTFYGCSSLTSIPTDLFRYNTAVSGEGFNATFRDCSSLTSIPTDLFRYNTLVSSNGFNQTFSGCTSLTTVPADIFLYNTACTDFTDVFFNCALTETSVDNFLVSLDDAGQSNGTADCDGGTSSAPSATGDAAVTSLQGKGWTVTTN